MALWVGGGAMGGVMVRKPKERCLQFFTMPVLAMLGSKLGWQLGKREVLCLSCWVLVRDCGLGLPLHDA